MAACAVVPVSACAASPDPATIALAAPFIALALAALPGISLLRASNNQARLVWSPIVGAALAVLVVVGWLGALALERQRLMGELVSLPSSSRTLSGERVVQAVDQARTIDQTSLLLLFGLALASAALCGRTCLAERSARRLALTSESQTRLLEHLPASTFQYREGRSWSDQPGAVADPLGDLLWQIADEHRGRVLEAVRGAESSLEVRQASFLSPCDSGDQQCTLTAVPILDPTGRYIHVRVLVQDESLEIERRQATERAEETMAELEQHLEAFVTSMVRAIEAKDQYTAGHSERVMRYAVWIGQELGVSPYEKRLLELGCLVHDIGKIGVPDAVLTKPGKLDDAEFEMIKRHTVHGFDILDEIPAFRDVLPIVRWHHEKLDGSGYPDGLIGEQVPFLVRIATVADTFDAVTSRRAYRDAMTVADAMAILVEEACTGKLDPVVVDAMRAVVQRHGLIDQDWRHFRAA
jgi:HD-GYP domain-containing protein (c-di-GMP phosphodiesterase class II)